MNVTTVVWAIPESLFISEKVANLILAREGEMDKDVAHQCWDR